MEALGRVNCYRTVDLKQSRLFINMSCGVTPFIHFIDGVEYRSEFYRNTLTSIKVEFAHYRPQLSEFMLLSPSVQEHVLNGGLINAPLGDAVPLRPDPVEENWEYERFQEWCLSYYGRRLGRLEE